MVGRLLAADLAPRQVAVAMLHPGAVSWEGYRRAFVALWVAGRRACVCQIEQAGLPSCNRALAKRGLASGHRPPCAALPPAGGLGPEPIEPGPPVCRW